MAVVAYSWMMLLAADDLSEIDAKLLDRRYDEVVVVTTHNAMANAADGYYFPNQSRSIPQQLAAGVRGLMLDVHRHRGRPELIHGYAALGHRPLVAGLQEIDAFLRQNRQAVVTLILENYVTAKELEQAFRDAKLLGRCHVQDPGKPWPKLREMVRRDRRLVVFTDREGGERPWLLKTWDHAWETPFAAKQVKDLSNRKNRGRGGAPLVIFNHFLTRAVGAEPLARQANEPEVLRKRLADFQQQYGRRPNFVTVDFFEIGGPVPLVAKLNGLKP